MTAPAPPPIDIVTVAIAIATAMFGQEMAYIVGPYTVIVLGAALGGAWSASRREQGAGGGTLKHMVLVIGWALLITVPLAYLGEKHFGLEAKWLFGPVAVVIAGIGHDWPRVMGWGLGQARALIERWVSRKGEQP